SGVRRHPPDVRGSGHGLHPALVLGALQRAFPDATWTADQGEHAAHAIHYLEIDRPGAFRTALGFASMGNALGMAMGLLLSGGGAARPPGVGGAGGSTAPAGAPRGWAESHRTRVPPAHDPGPQKGAPPGGGGGSAGPPPGLRGRAAGPAAAARAFGALGVVIR